MTASPCDPGRAESLRLVLPQSLELGLKGGQEQLSWGASPLPAFPSDRPHLPDVSESEPPAGRRIYHGARKSGWSVDRQGSLSACPAGWAGGGNPGFAQTEREPSGRLGAFSTLCADSASPWRGLGVGLGAGAGGAGPGRPGHAPRAHPPQEAPGPATPRPLPPWPHAGRRSPRSLCPRARGRWAQAARGPGPGSAAFSAAWRTPLRTRRCSWTRRAVAVGALGLESRTAGHLATQRDPASPAEMTRRPRQVWEGRPA